MKYLKRHIIGWSLILSCVSTPALCQSAHGDEPAGMQHIIGLNTFGLLNQLLDRSDSSEFRTPFLFTYTGDMGRMALRAGIGPRYKSETIVHQGFTDSEETSTLQIDGRLGVGMYFLNDGKWSALAGVDAVISYLRDRSIDDSGFDRITNQVEKTTYGGGPFIEFAFQVSPRVSLGAETALYWMYGKSKHSEVYKNFPDFSTVFSETTISELNITLPNTLFLRIHF